MYVYGYISMKKVCIYFDLQQIEALKELSEETGAPVAELVRRAIDQYLKKREKDA